MSKSHGSSTPAGGLPGFVPPLDLAEKRDELQRIASSRDGVKVKEMLESRVDLETAVSRGDTASLIGAVSSALQSAEGQRLAESLRRLMEK